MKQLLPPEPARGLPRRDVWLLPLIGLATALVMLGGAELAARIVWPEQTENACRMADPQLGHRYAANCTSVTKAAEGPWVTNSYNGCGYRSAMPCTDAPAGTMRVALIGSSLSEGYMVPFAQTVGATLAADLTHACGLPVDIQNLGGIGYSGHLLVTRMVEALRLKPQVVLLLLAPFDLEGELQDAAPPSSGKQAPSAVDGLQHRIFDTLKDSRASLVAQHFLFQNPSVYLPLYLRYGDKADFLRPPFTPNWQARLNAFDTLLGELSQKAHDANVRLVFGFVPQEAQVALMAGRPMPSGIDPTALPRALQVIADRDDVAFVDTSAALRVEPTPEQLFYQVDGHLSGRGQPIISAYIAAKMIADPRDAFAGCRRLASASGGT